MTKTDDLARIPASYGLTVNMTVIGRLKLEQDSMYCGDGCVILSPAEWNSLIDALRADGLLQKNGRANVPVWDLYAEDSEDAK